MKHVIDGETIRLELSRPELQSLIDHPLSRMDIGDTLRAVAREYDDERTREQRRAAAERVRRG